MLSDLLSVKLSSVLGIKEGIRAAAMRRGGFFCSTRIFYNRSLGPADRKGIRPARPAGRNRRVEKITIGTALCSEITRDKSVARKKHESSQGLKKCVRSAQGPANRVSRIAIIRDRSRVAIRDPRKDPTPNFSNQYYLLKNVQISDCLFVPRLIPT